ncbi:MAG: hypothetical protein JJU46_14180 [Balneolaceae bacterium]|nr:hypothetical protein [Balneolaceae bacterium]MCH8549801.1 hypothetical protein [Balneolaceae bacterium]
MAKKEPEFEYKDEKVYEVSSFLQGYMKRNNIKSMTPDECADILASNEILPNDLGPKPGFNFRQMLRDGRDGLIPQVKGAYQERPKTRWVINYVDP